MTQRPLAVEAIATTIRAIPERRNLPPPVAAWDDHCLEVYWALGPRRVTVTVSRVFVLLSRSEEGRPTRSDVIARDCAELIRKAIDWLIEGR